MLTMYGIKKTEIQLKIMEDKKIKFSHLNYNLINTENKVIGKDVSEKKI